MDLYPTVVEAADMVAGLEGADIREEVKEVIDGDLLRWTGLCFVLPTSGREPLDSETFRVSEFLPLTSAATWEDEDFNGDVVEADVRVLKFSARLVVFALLGGYVAVGMHKVMSGDTGGRIRVKGSGLVSRTVVLTCVAVFKACRFVALERAVAEVPLGE